MNICLAITVASSVGMCQYLDYNIYHWCEGVMLASLYKYGYLPLRVFEKDPGV